MLPSFVMSTSLHSRGDCNARPSSPIREGKPGSVSFAPPGLFLLSVLCMLSPLCGWQFRARFLRHRLHTTDLRDPADADASLLLQAEYLDFWRWGGCRRNPRFSQRTREPGHKASFCSPHMARLNVVLARSKSKARAKAKAKGKVKGQGQRLRSKAKAKGKGKGKG